MSRLLRVTGWSLIGAGALVLLYLLYTLVFTGFAAASAQRELEQQWRGQLDPAPAAEPEPATGDRPDAAEQPDVDRTGEPAEDQPADPPGQPTVGAVTTDARPSAPAAEQARPPAVGEAVAAIEFSRDGRRRRPVSADPLFVVHGVRAADLRKGPGHYPDSAGPGEPGNFAVAGHRTTYGAPFSRLDELRPGDTVHVTDRAGARWDYRVVEQRVVSPSDVWVLGADPLGRGTATLTLTTCHPRFSARQRLIVFAELTSGRS